MILKDFIMSCYGNMEVLISKHLETTEPEYYLRSESLSYWQSLFKNGLEIKLYHKLGDLDLSSFTEIDHFTVISKKFIIYLK